MIGDLFSSLGFNEREVDVYLALGDSGRTTAYELSKSLQLARSSVYSLLDQLCSKGMVICSEEDSTKYYTARDPEVLIELLAEEKKELEHKETRARELADILGPSFKTKSQSNLPRIEIASQRKNIIPFLQQLLGEWRKDPAPYNSEIWGYQEASFVYSYRQFSRYRWKTRSANERVHLFCNDELFNDKDNLEKTGRILKRLPAGLRFSSNTWVMGRRVVFISTKPSPHVAYVLRDPTLASNMSEIFKWLWSQV